MRTVDFNIHTLIEDLQGTCHSINDHLPDGMDEDDLTMDELDHIDQEIFLCAECGWWCEVSESNDKDGENG